MITTFKVITDDLEVDHLHFSFSYSIFCNGKKRNSGKYESDHAWGDALKEFKKLLNTEGYLAAIALENIS